MSISDSLIDLTLFSKDYAFVLARRAKEHIGRILTQYPSSSSKLYEWEHAVNMPYEKTPNWQFSLIL
jgi:hypothetical protein